MGVSATTTSPCSLDGPSDGETRTGPIPTRIQGYLVCERVSEEWGRATDSEREAPATTVHTCPLCDRIVLRPRCLFAASPSPPSSCALPRVEAALSRTSSLIEHRTNEHRAYPTVAW